MILLRTRKGTPTGCPFAFPAAWDAPEAVRRIRRARHFRHHLHHGPDFARMPVSPGVRAKQALARAQATSGPEA